MSTDLAVEQKLTSSVNETTGVTRGRGMIELQRAKWLLAIPTCAEEKLQMML